MVRIPPASAGDTRDVGLIPLLGRSPGGGNGNSLQYSFGKSHGQKTLEAVVHGKAESDTTGHTYTFLFFFCFGGKTSTPQAPVMGTWGGVSRRNHSSDLSPNT